MPELPDVEALRAAVEWECQGRRLLRAELISSNRSRGRRKKGRRKR